MGHMRFPLSNQSFWFHKLSNDRSQRGLITIPVDSEDWPDNWKKIEYKTYPYADTVYSLPPLQLEDALTDSWWSVISKRRSRRNFDERNITVTFEQLSLITKICFGEDEKSKRISPSAGARYPLEYYLLIERVTGVKRGIYHYNIKDHSLERILRPENYETEVDSIFMPWVQESAVCVCISSVFDRTMRKYGERGYRYILLEAGHIGQLLYETCTLLDIAITGLGAVNESYLEGKLGLSENEESLIYTLPIG